MDLNWPVIVQPRPMKTGKGPVGAMRSCPVMKLEELGLDIMVVETNHLPLCGYPCLGTQVGKMEIKIARPLIELPEQ